MSSNANLHRQLLDAKLNNTSLRDVYVDWQRTHCVDPQKVYAFDSHTQTRRLIQVDCGRCPHCVQTKINEWVTRMYAHAEDYKNVYFITLTYRSFYNIDRSVNRLLIQKLCNAVWHYDSFNEFHRTGWNPCILCKEHYQNFLKRLRANTGYDDITYVLSGEYGHKFGRPHFHMILFSNHDISRADIVRAWSVALFRKSDGTYVYRRNHKRDGIALDFPIGRVDYHNLVTNGTFNTTAKIKVDGNFMNASNCFGYVCKYVCKRDNVNYSRVSMAYNSLWHSKSYVKVFDNVVQWLHIKKYLQDYGYPFELLDNQIKILKKYCYEKIEFSPDMRVYSENLQPSKAVSIFGHVGSIEVLPQKYYDFRRLFSPFCEFSRATPIGSIYATRHLQEFKEGIFNRPLLQDTSFVVPSYFRRKASNDFYGLRSCHQTLKSKSFNFGGLLDLYRRFSSSLQTGLPPREHFFSKTSAFTVEQALQTSYRYFADLSTGTRVILYDLSAVSYRYSRHLRKFVEYDRCPLDYWLRHWLIKLELELERHDAALFRSKVSADHLDKSFKLLEHSVDKMCNLRTFFKDKLDKEIQEQQKLYHSSHKSLE